MVIHNPKVGGSIPPPATKTITLNQHLTFQLGVDDKVYFHLYIEHSKAQANRALVLV